MMTPESHRTRVFVAGGSPVLVTVLSELLEGSPNLVVGTRPYVVQAGLGFASDARERIRSTGPDVVLLTLSHDDAMAALPAVREIVQACNGSRLVILLESPDWATCLPLLRAGVSGMLGPGFRREDLLRALDLAAEGKPYFDPRMPRGGAAFELGPASDNGSGKSLSVREAEVLALVARGYSNKAVAAVLNVSVKTIETYRARGMDKLGLKSRIDLAHYAATCGWI